MTGAMKELDRLYLGGLLDHGGDEVLAWCASNVVARMDDAENIKPSKAKSNEKVDDYVALLNAIAVSLGEPASPYSDGRGSRLPPQPGAAEAHPAPTSARRGSPVAHLRIWRCACYRDKLLGLAAVYRADVGDYGSSADRSRQ